MLLGLQQGRGKLVDTKCARTCSTKNPIVRLRQWTLLFKRKTLSTAITLKNFQGKFGIVRLDG
jgi:hypothetical protein